MPDNTAAPIHTPEKPAATATDAEVYAIYGAEPEVQAYAMAKYSRSSLSMKESLKEISEQKAEKFLNTFYFQYGHRSIADLAHVALAIERLSILAAIAVVDEQRWDGQERSTRYQNFKKSGWHSPSFGGNSDVRERYRAAIATLFAEYESTSQAVFEHLVQRTHKPGEMSQESYDRTLRARAFDAARYLLPLATNTSLGEIVNARTLETQIAHLLSSEYAEVRRIAELMKRAAREPAYNVSSEAVRSLLTEIGERDPGLHDRAERQLLKEVRVAPTLVKYAEANEYEIRTRQELRDAARQLMNGAPVDSARAVDLLEDDPVEIELAATLLYEHCAYPYRQIRPRVDGLSEKEREEILQMGTRHRGKHDELLRAFSAGQRFRFDILMDIGGFRDMHRHRRCVQIGQDFTFAHGYDTPAEVVDAGTADRYSHAMDGARAIADQIAGDLPASERKDLNYLIPLGYRKRTLFKMDFAEALYISELRTGPAGHTSYRKVAYEMYRAVAQRHPSLAPYFRVTDVNEPIDLLKR
ncbi:MAG: FAD-dependent thymidylate synthase [Acidobacteria bacterium]|nr:FAD-dependent thymidylate synthase [Acidobacteriota bacterium]